MQYVDHNFNVRLDKKVILDEVRIAQGNNLKDRLNISLLYKDAPYEMQSGDTAELIFLRPDGEKTSPQLNAEFSGNIVTQVLDEVVLAVAGYVEGQVNIKDSAGSIVATARFEFFCSESIEGAPEIGSRYRAIKDMQRIVENAQKSVESAKSDVLKSLETARQEMTPKINASGSWVIGGVDTGKPARGPKGADGTVSFDKLTPGQKKELQVYPDASNTEKGVVTVGDGLYATSGRLSTKLEKIPGVTNLKGLRLNDGVLEVQDTAGTWIKTALAADLGDKTQLKTTDKTSAVNAINEIATNMSLQPLVNIGGGVSYVRYGGIIMVSISNLNADDVNLSLLPMAKNYCFFRVLAPSDGIKQIAYFEYTASTKKWIIKATLAGGYGSFCYIAAD